MKKISKVQRSKMLNLLSILQNQTRGENCPEQLKHIKTQIQELRNKLNL